jgi:hypothetical protein
MQCRQPSGCYIVADRRPYRIAVTDQVIRLRSIIVLIG